MSMHIYHSTAPMPGSTRPPLDEEVLASLRELQMEGEPDLLRELFDLFQEDTPGHFEAIRAAIAARDADALRHAAHTAKGSSANLGAAVLATVCKELEDLGRAGTTAGASAFLDRAEYEYGRAVAALEQELGRVAV